MKILDFLDALRPQTGLSLAKRREREVDKRMNWLLKQDRETFKKGLRELGINENDEEFRKALNVYDATS